jgi:hypothetical protein
MNKTAFSIKFTPSRVIATSVTLAIAILFAVRHGDCQVVVEPPESAARSFVEVAKLYQRGTDRVELDQVKQLISECTEKYDSHLRHNKQSAEFYKRLDEFLGYMDSHRIEASDIDALREWGAATVECTDQARDALRDAAAFRMAATFSVVWQLVQREVGNYEPRHAVLCSVLSVSTASLPGLTYCVLSMNVNRMNQDREESPDVMKLFLLEKQNAALLAALLKDIKPIERALMMPEGLRADELTQELLNSKKDPRQFKQALETLLPLCEKTLKAFPAYALPERYNDIGRMREVWNIVHAYGDAESQADVKQGISSLRDLFAKRSDPVAAKWLEQAMDAPGKPVKKYLYEYNLKLKEPQGAK